MRWYLLLFIVVAAAFNSSSVQAQQVVGFRFGINVSDVGGEVPSSSDIGTRTGFAVGLFGTVPLRYSLALQPEVLYTQKGLSTVATVRDDAGMAIGMLDVRVELTYLEFPVLLKYRLLLGQGPSFSLYAGPQVSFELAERLIVDGIEGSQESAQFRSPEYGFALGADVETPLLGLDGLLGIRYSRGVGSVIENQGNALEGSDVYNQSLSFFLGIHLR